MNDLQYVTIYTAGAMQPSKRGNFFHIESVQPMTEGMILTFQIYWPQTTHDQVYKVSSPLRRSIFLF